MTSLTLRLGEGSLQVSSGLRLRYLSWEVTEARAAVVVVHGLSDHAARYARMAQALADINVSTFALDLRGNGLSEGRRGHANSFGCFLQDLDRFRREVSGLIHPSTPLYLFGHSMGGLIALRYQQEYAGAFRGMIVSSPWLATAVPVPRWKSTLANLLARVLPAAPFSSKLKAEHMSHDAAAVQAYRDDPLVHDRITPRLFTEVSREMAVAFQRIDRIQGPILLLLAGADRVVDTERSLVFARSLSGRDVTLKVYPGYYHEILHESGAALVQRDINDWILKRTE
jgi:alpha-beta hydrolase superfamily lysophospholipase